MKWMLAIFSCLLLSQFSIGQDKKIDQLEILYDQGYYSKVIRKSNKLLADPAFDYSALPSYYKSISLFRMANDERWLKRHKNAITEAIDNYEDFSQHSNYSDYVNAHYYEISSVKTYLVNLGKKYEELGFRTESKQISDFSFKYLKSIKGKPDKHENINNPDNENKPDVAGTASSDREKLVVYAKSLVGIKYVWAGSSESGFDCSGFTSYVCKKFGIQIARTASGQLEEAKKVKLDNAQKGDLVFFGSGAKITHVGLVVSNKGDDISMVHASTSKGVIVTNVENSSYWKPKLKASGTYL